LAREPSTSFARIDCDLGEFRASLDALKLDANFLDQSAAEPMAPGSLEAADDSLEVVIIGR
jgi:hypothetical protein